MKNYTIYLEDMLHFAAEAVTIARMKGNDRLRQLALERALVMIGEAAKKIPHDSQANYPDILWREIIDLRNIISHGYDDYTLAELEAIATQEMQELAHLLQKILAPTRS